jgi:hypothetical protein
VEASQWTEEDAMRLQTNPPTGAARLAVSGLAVAALALALGGLAGCSDDSTDEPSADTAGVDTLPSTADSSPSESVSGDEVLSSFSDSFDDDHNGWALPPSDSGTTTVEGGDFVWDSKKYEQRPHVIAETVGEAFDRGRLDMTDVRVTASVTPQRGVAAIGVYCREAPDTDSDFSWYEFVVRDGYAAIRLADSAGDLDPLAETEDAALPLGAATTIEATCVDGADGTAALSMSLDGAELLTAEVSDPLGNGGAGLQAYDAAEDQADDPMLIAWHDFSVEQAS